MVGMHNPKQLMPEILAALQQGPMTRPLLMTALGCRLQPRYFTYAVTLLVGDQDWFDFSGVAICSPKTHSFDPDGGSLTIGRGKGGKTSTHTVARDRPQAAQDAQGDQRTLGV